jgi:TonB family protein
MNIRGWLAASIVALASCIFGGSVQAQAPSSQERAAVVRYMKEVRAAISFNGRNEWRNKTARASVLVSFAVLRDGRTTDIRIIRSRGNPGAREVATRVVSRGVPPMPEHIGAAKINVTVPLVF